MSESSAARNGFIRNCFSGRARILLSAGSMLLRPVEDECGEFLPVVDTAPVPAEEAES